VIAPTTRVSACVQHPIVAVTVSGEAREDGGGISGPQIIRLALTYDGGPGPAQVSAKFGNWQDTHRMPAWPLTSRLIHVLGHRRLEEHLRSDVPCFQHSRPHLRGLLFPQISDVAMVDTRTASAWSSVVFDRRTPL
jgi:hypothetical protein